MMRAIARFFLWLIGAAVPVVIAACYGAPYRFSKCGKVIDEESKEGIGGIEVTCMHEGGLAGDATHTGVEGDFCISYDEPCVTLDLVDVDGDINGAYPAQSVPFDDDGGDLTVELSK